MTITNHKIARDFFSAFFAGKMTEEHLTSDMTAWTTLGPMEKMQYVASVKQVIALFQIPGAAFEYTIDAITAEDDRVAVEAHSKAKFADGEDYAMSYVFALRIRDGKVSSVAEHFNPIPVLEKIFPRMQSGTKSDAEMAPTL